MFRVTRPLYQVLKQSTGITGLAVHPDPIPELLRLYKSTLATINSIPQTSVYRQGVESLVKQKLGVVERANGDIAQVEKDLNEGQIEESIVIAADELGLASKILEWKAWEPLAEQPPKGQWEYFK